MDHPDTLRAQAGGPRVEVVGHGFSENALALLRARPEVSAAERQNGRLSLLLRPETDIAPLINLMVGAGVQVEEVRKGKASLEEVFLSMMMEEEE